MFIYIYIYVGRRIMLWSREMLTKEKKKTSFIKRSYHNFFNYYLRSLVMYIYKASKAKHFIILRNLNKSLNYFLFISLLCQRKKKDVFL